MPNTQTVSFETARAEDGKWGELWFVSLDGEEWLGVREDPRQADIAEVRELFQPHNGFLPMRMARGFLADMLEARFYGR